MFSRRFSRQLGFAAPTLRRALCSVSGSSLPPSSNLSRYGFEPPPYLSPHDPTHAAEGGRPRRRKEKPRYRPPSSLDREGRKPLHSDLPFDFRFSYTESNPDVKPIGLREPKYSPFGPDRIDRFWTGNCAPAVDPTVRSVDGDGGGDGGDGKKGASRRKSREEILGEPLTPAEMKILVEKCQRHRTKRQVNLGRDGLIHNMLNDIHNNWKHAEAVRIKCLGVPTVDMNNVCTQLEVSNPCFADGGEGERGASRQEMNCDFFMWCDKVQSFVKTTTCEKDEKIKKLENRIACLEDELRGSKSLINKAKVVVQSLPKTFAFLSILDKDGGDGSDGDSHSQEDMNDKTGGQIIHRKGGTIILYRGRYYNPKKRPVIPLMLWKPHEPIYPKLIKTVIDGLTVEETKEMRKKGLMVPVLTKLAKNGYYANLVTMIRDAFMTDELVRIDCKGLERSDYKKIGAKLRDLVPCVLVTFEKEQIVVWRGKNYNSSVKQIYSEYIRSSTEDKLDNDAEKDRQNGIFQLSDDASESDVEQSTQVPFEASEGDTNEKILSGACGQDCG
ncbi:hypothetical protein Taro_017951 [Colocasia esculenta]|uniref:CRM domain-containing protein n=1 Tax=Colocasia esculenta TaxID=4460 RepID=A0A843UHG0_COLES|nr:hypothetical protein [Colocasia esculenta]